MKILLIGKDGQVGQELQITLPSLGEVIGVDREIMDLTQPESIRQVIAQVKPDVVVNAAAYTAVDKAETESELAYTVNALAPGILAEECQKLGATLLHISTDYVFDGSKGSPYTEEDNTNPLGIYGKSKLAGEEAIEKACERYLILRTAWVYGVYGKGNFVKTMLRLGGERQQLRVVADQIGSPTWARDIADAITKLIAPDANAATGIYHFTDSGAASWYDFTRAIFDQVRQLGVSLQVQEVVPITTPEYPTPAKRPSYSVLAHQKISPILGTYPPYWRDSLKMMLKQLYA